MKVNEKGLPFLYSFASQTGESESMVRQVPLHKEAWWGEAHPLPEVVVSVDHSGRGEDGVPGRYLHYRLSLAL